MRLRKKPKISLTCPDCEQDSAFPESALVAGQALPCPHCGMELTLTHDRDTPDGPPIWRLEIPETGEDRSAAP